MGFIKCTNIRLKSGVIVAEGHLSALSILVLLNVIKFESVAFYVVLKRP